MSTPKVPGRLQLRAEELGLSQTAIGEKVGRTQSSVQRWFDQDRVPADYQAAVAEILKVRVGWVAGDGGPAVEPAGESEAFAAGRRAGIEEAIRLLVAAIGVAATPPVRPESTVDGAFEEAAPHLETPPPVPDEKPEGRRRKA